MGYLLQELFAQAGTDRSAAAYLENPGASDFNEGVPGLAAWCALCVLVLPGESARRTAAAVLGGAALESSRIDIFCRIAEQRRRRLNPDLLAESLAARRRRRGDLPRLGELLHSLARGEERDTAERIRRVLDPGFRPPAPAPAAKAPAWEILGLGPAATVEEAKSAYRRLAIQFHPDSVSGLSAEQQAEAAKAFIKIQEAYREVTEGRK
jgi:DnaJ like chaperone protein